MTDINAVLKAFPVGAMRCNGFDVGTVVRELIAAPAPPQPIYDEAAETLLARFSYDARLTAVSWSDFKSGWIACAQSRAKAGEVV